MSLQTNMPDEFFVAIFAHEFGLNVCLLFCFITTDRWDTVTLINVFVTLQWRLVAGFIFRSTARFFVRFQNGFVLKWFCWNWMRNGVKSKIAKFRKMCKNQITHRISCKNSFWSFLAIYDELCNAPLKISVFEMFCHMVCNKFSLCVQFPCALLSLLRFQNNSDNNRICAPGYHRDL